MPHSDPVTAAPSFELFRVDAAAPAIVPARSRREWMDETASRFAYRCTPMTIANASGWELRCPFAFDAEWNGGDGVEAITVHTGAPAAIVASLVASHFGHGILTFHTGWLVRTAPGWATWTRGAPNAPKHGIAALDGLVETDWLPFPFTMNWRFTAPGRVRFEEDEPFCFMTPVPHLALDDVRPVVRDLSAEPELERAYHGWRESRADFNARLRSNEESAVREGWQRDYVRASGTDPERSFHKTKRALAAPVQER